MMQTAPRILLAVSLALVLAFGAATDTRAYDRPEGSSGFTQKTLAKAKRHMVVAANPLAAEAGLATLRKGGSAVDAAIATQMVLNVVEPQSSGLGGGAFLLTWDQATKTLLNIDGRETAPEAATPELFLDAAGKPLPFKQAVESGRSVGVPGVLAALKLAHDKYGKLPWAELFAPAITLARDGFSVSPRLAKLLAESDPASFAPAARAYFFDPAGRPRPEGYKLKNPPSPPLSRRSPETVPPPSMRATSPATSRPPCKAIRAGRASSRREDLAHYRAKLREPVCVPIAASRSAAWRLLPPARLPWPGAGTDRAFRSRQRPARRPARASHRRGRAARFRRPRALPRRSGFRARPGRRACSTKPISTSAAPSSIQRARLGRSTAGTPPNDKPRRLRQRRDAGECRHQPYFHRR